MSNAALKTIISLGLIIVASACGTTAPTRYYTLSNTDINQIKVDNKANAKGINIQIGAVSIPEIVDRSQLVISNVDNRVNILDNDRWAQPLRNEISTAIIAGLKHNLPNATITDSRIKAIEPDYRISLDVRKFEATKDKVLVNVLWKIERVKDVKTINQDSYASESVNGSDNEQVVVAHSRALQRISQEIAIGLKSL